MTEEQKEKYLYDGRNPVCARLAAWWYKHDEFDKRRRAEEEVNALQERARAAGKDAYDAGL